MSNEFKSLDDFLLSFNANPLETIRIMNQNRTFSNREWTKSIYKILQEKLSKGNTLAEVYELASIKPEENLWKLLNTWLTLRDAIDEAKGVYPFTDGLWRAHHPTLTYISLKDKPLNDVKVPLLVLEKFFKVYRPLDIGEHKEIFIEYDGVEYAATITREEKEELLLHWDEGFVDLLKNLYPNSYTEPHEMGIFDYELECRLFWHSGYKGIYACFDVHDLYIVLNKNLSNEIEVPSIPIEKFFRLGRRIENKESFRLTLQKEEDRYKRGKEFHGYIRKDGEKFFLKWDEKFIQLLNEQLPKDFFIKEQSDFLWQLHLRWSGASYTWWFDFTKRSLINKIEDNAILLDLRDETSTVQPVSISSNEVSTIDGNIGKEKKSVVNSEIENIEITETEREQVIKSRIGQSAFKKVLLAREKKCRLCGVLDERFLVASHIKPWSQSDNQERLDVNNGVLLCPNHDALFDKGYISFNDDGTVLISTSLDDNSKVFLNISDKVKISINESQRQYMKWHRKNVLKM